MILKSRAVPWPDKGQFAVFKPYAPLFYAMGLVWFGFFAFAARLWVELLV